MKGMAARASGMVIVAILLAGCVQGAASRDGDAAGSAPDRFDEILASADRQAFAIPTDMPPGARFVFLSTSDGAQTLAVQHEDVMVTVCGISDHPCVANGERLRTFARRGTRFEIVVSPLSKLPTDELMIPPELGDYWRDVRFGSSRPPWLTMALYPGVSNEVALSS